MFAQLSEAVIRVLDGHDFEFEGAACRVEVYGVYDDGQQRWLQLALQGDHLQMLTLRFVPSEVPDCSLVSLAVSLTPA